MKTCLKLAAAVFLLSLTAEFGYRALLWATAKTLGRGESNVFDLYVIGESTATGQPYPSSLSFPILVSGIFGGEIGGRRIVVTNLARSGESIYPQCAALERALRGRNARNPGAVFIYSGHNDARNRLQTPLFEFFKEEALFGSALLRDLFFWAEKASLIPRVRSFHTWEFYLRRSIEMSLRAGLVPIIATNISNVTDIDPGLFPSPGLPESSRARIKSALNIGEELEAKGKFRAAMVFYKKTSAELPGLAPYLRYRIANCHRGLGEYKAAAALYQACVDFQDIHYDDNFGRATARQNALIRGLAREYAVPLVDCVKVFEDKSPHGLVGGDLMIDGHHPNFKGYLLMADAYARAVSQAFGEPVKRTPARTKSMFDELGYGRQEEAGALISSGRWLFSVSMGHLYPFQRLKMAESRFRAARNLEPDNFSACLGLALTQAAARGKFASRQTIDWLSRDSLFYGGNYAVSRNSEAEILRKLKYQGVPEALLKDLARTYRLAGLRRTQNEAASGGPARSPRPWMDRDSKGDFWIPDYLDLGATLWHGVAMAGPPVSFRMPMASILTFLCSDHWRLEPRLLELILNTSEVVLIFALGCALTTLTGLLASLLSLLWLPAASFNELVFSVLVLIVANLMAWRAREASPLRSLLLAVSIGSSLLFRSPLAFFPPILAIFEWLTVYRRSIRACWKQLLILGLAPYLFLLPWISMNWRLYHRFIPFENAAADSNIVAGAVGLRETVEGDLSTIMGARYDPLRADSILSWAMREIARHPARYFLGVIARLKFVFLIQPLAFLAALLALLRRDSGVFRRELGLLALYYVGIHCLMAVEARYFDPLWPLLLVLAASLAATGAKPDPRPSATIEQRLSQGIVGFYLAAVAALSLCSLWLVGSYVDRASRGSLDSAIRTHPDDAWLLSRRGKERMNRGVSAGAADDFSQALSLRPGDPELALEFSWARSLQGHPDQLLRWSGSSTYIDFKAHLLAAVACLRLGRAGQSKEHLRAALSAYDSWRFVRGARTQGELRMQAKIRSFQGQGFLRALNGAIAEATPRDRLGLINELAHLVPLSPGFSLERAELALQSGDEALALKSLGGAKDLEAGGEDALRLFEIYRTLVVSRLARSPKELAACLEQADMAVRAGKRGLALKSLARAQALRPSAGELTRIVRLYEALKEYRQALNARAALTRQLPDDSLLWIDQAENAVRLGDRGPALKFLAQAQTLRPSADELRRSVRLYEVLKEHRLALNAQAALTRLLPNDARPRLDQADMAIRLGERGLAIRSLTQAQTLGPGAGELSRIARLYEVLKENRQALNAQAALTRLLPNDARPWIDQADMAVRLGDGGLALKSLAQAQSLNPGDGEARRIAGFYQKLHEQRRALGLLRPLAERLPRDAGLWLDQAEAAIATGERALAISSLAHAEALQPAAVLSRRIALCYQELKKYDKAASILGRLVRENPREAALLADLGLCRYLQGSGAQAIEDLKRALQLDKGLLSAYLTLGSIYSERKRYDDARRLYDRALALASGKEGASARELILRSRQELPPRGS